ncbi:MAG: DnaD domain protein [Clostridia bacterium]|nr:DnaD domain protein [Clostridia bacterium]
MTKTTSEKKLQLEKFFYRSLTQDMVMVPSLLLRHYQEIGLSKEEFITLLSAISVIPKGKEYFTLNELAIFINTEQNKLADIIKSLSEKGFISKVKNQLVIDAYSIEGLYDKLFEVWVYVQACPTKTTKPQTASKKATKKELGQIYTLFEGELGRPLSPTEGEKITFWLVSEGWDPLMVKEALTRAVIHGTSNLVYIDRILERWRKEGIRELSQLSAETAKPAKQGAKKTKKTPKVMCSDTNYENVFNRN